MGKVLNIPVICDIDKRIEAFFGGALGVFLI